MAVMEYNKSPISVREGKGYIDGVEVLDLVAFSLNFTPDVWQGRQVGERTQSSRWLGYAISGSITRRRSTPWLKEKIAEYKSSGKTPEIKLQGLMNDENSDYYSDNGSDTVTAVGVVLTGDLNLMSLDSAGDVLDDVINFSAKDVVF